MNTKNPSPKTPKTPDIKNKAPQGKRTDTQAPADERGGFKDAGLAEPTRFGDWEVNGRCSDF